MKRVEVVVEREEMNSTKFDGVKEWGSAGCLGLGKGGRSVSVSMSNENEVAVTKRTGRNQIKSNEPIGSDSASETPKTGRPLPGLLLPTLRPTAGLLQRWAMCSHLTLLKWHRFSFFAFCTARIPSNVSITTT